MGLRGVFQNKVNVLATLSFFSITIIALFKNAAELEDAEQAYYSQWLRWGYDDQPPVYTWFQYLANTVLGVSKISFSLVRGIVFSGILWIFYRFAKSVLKEDKKSQLAVFALVLLPVFIDFTFRRLSHTSLLCLSVIATYWIVQRLLTKKSFFNYLLFGAIIGIGFLSKYNYVLFLGAFGSVAFFDIDIKKIVFHRYIFITAVVAMVIALPHYYWFLGPEGYLEDLKTNIRAKTESKKENTVFFASATISLLLGLVRVLAPLSIVTVTGLAFKKMHLKKMEKDWLYKLLVAQLIMLLFFFVVLDIQKVEERWLLPLLLPFLVLLLRSMTFKKSEIWVKTGFLVFLLVIAIQTIRTPIEKLMEIPSSVHFGFEPVSAILNKKYKDKLWVLPNVTYGGNIRLLNPEVQVFAKDDFSLPKSKLKQNKVVEIVLEKENLMGRKPLDSIIGFGKEKANLYMLAY